MTLVVATRALLALCLASCVLAAHAEPVEVSVRLNGDRVVVDVTAQVPVKREVAWGVLTDYEHMASYVSNLKLSRVLSRSGSMLQVEQSGEAKRAFLTFSFTTVRSVELVPEREIRSHLIRGDFKSYEFTTTLAGEVDGPVVITHHGEYVPTRWVPPVIGPSLIQAETRKQYAELINEMHVRALASAKSPK
jgi:hypothetical protein